MHQVWLSRQQQQQRNNKQACWRAAFLPHKVARCKRRCTTEWARRCLQRRHVCCGRMRRACSLGVFGPDFPNFHHRFRVVFDSFQLFETEANTIERRSFFWKKRSKTWHGAEMSNMYIQKSPQKLCFKKRGFWSPSYGQNVQRSEQKLCTKCPSQLGALRRRSRYEGKRKQCKYRNRKNWNRYNIFINN